MEKWLSSAVYDTIKLIRPKQTFTASKLFCHIQKHIFKFGNWSRPELFEVFGNVEKLRQRSCHSIILTLSLLLKLLCAQISVDHFGTKFKTVFYNWFQIQFCMKRKFSQCGNKFTHSSILPWMYIEWISNMLYPLHVSNKICHNRTYKA